ncbi:nuclease-related domain-containing protein [Fibrobacter sp. UWB5]|uniref:nuclease-related domain-containing protein n=1 Tax=Fibrobacter sp. UWB5 TaxID=1964360 RepID=UPI000B525968|nr:nuclease-related domain-containing protein [Fibrobacter sp. UWB5]OWV14645.1 hypothetical protein B7989_04155 [Fibrobacter sp. UWB5]
MLNENPFMTLERARSVYWLKNNYRPMGELFDNGFLNTRRLEWGANNAYDPTIKAACQVLLKQKQKTTKAFVEKGKLPRNIDEARAVVWPFSKNLGKTGRTMGELTDNRDITKRDLAYALEKAWDEQVREASRIILTSQLGIENDRANETKGALKVTANRSFMEEQIERLSFKKGAFIGILLTICAFLLIADFVYMGMKGAIPALAKFILDTKYIGLAFIILFIIFVLVVANFVIKHTLEKKIDNYDESIRNHKQGRDGEDKVVDVMRETLDGSCHVFRNCVLPDKKGDIDAILVSPQGLFVFEVKNYNMKCENTQDEWFFYSGKKKKKLKENPSIQAKRNAARLAEHLEADFSRNKERKWVNPIVVMANADVVCLECEPVVPIWRIQYLSDELGNIPNKREISEQLQSEICKKLELLYSSN